MSATPLTAVPPLTAVTIVETVSRLNALLRLNQASERGFATAAEHVKNRGLKIHLKSYAEQRAQFAEALRQAVLQLGWEVTYVNNPLAGIHRGWIDIVATLTIGRMNQARMVLHEVLRGEELALHRYQEACREQHLPAINLLLEEQMAQIRAAHEHLSGIIAYQPNVLLVQLFERSDSAQTALANLLAAGVAAADVQITPVAQIRRYTHTDHRQLLLESTVACALMGMVVGICLGLMTSIPLMLSGMLAGIGGFGVPLWSGALVGIAGGIIFGLLIGQGIGEDDAYFYQTGLSDGSTVVSVRAANAPAQQAHQILEMQRNEERQAAFALVGAAV